MARIWSNWIIAISPSGIVTIRAKDCGAVKIRSPIALKIKTNKISFFYLGVEKRFCLLGTRWIADRFNRGEGRVAASWFEFSSSTLEEEKPTALVESLFFFVLLFDKVRIVILMMLPRIGLNKSFCSSAVFWEHQQKKNISLKEQGNFITESTLRFCKTSLILS